LFAPSDHNKYIFAKYSLLIKNVPKNIYRIIKKLLNPNPRTRIKFNKVVQMFAAEYNQILYNPVSYKPALIFNAYVLYSPADADLDLLTNIYDKFPPMITVIGFYAYTRVKKYFSKAD